MMTSQEKAEGTGQSELLKHSNAVDNKPWSCEVVRDVTVAA